MNFVIWFVLACLSGSTVACTQTVETSTSNRAFPRSLVGGTEYLEFHASTPSASGSLQTQARIALRMLLRNHQGAKIVKLRVFALGTELSAVEQIVSTTFTSKKRPLPVLSLIGVAGFPKPGQRLVVESVAVGKKRINPFGVAFLAGVQSPRGDQAISGLAQVARGSGIAMPNVTRVSCFYQSPEQAMAAKTAISDTFPAAESSFVLSVATDAKPVIECEGVARLPATIPEGIRYFNLPGTKTSPYFSRAALVSTPNLIFTGAEMALGDSEPAVREPFERAKKAVEQLGGKLPDVVMYRNYWLTSSARERNRAVRTDYFGQTVPAATGVFFTGLSSPRATEAIELVVALTSAVTLSVSNPLGDGRPVYKPHLTTLVDSVTKDGIVLRSNSYTLDIIACCR